MYVGNLFLFLHKNYSLPPLLRRNHIRINKFLLICNRWISQNSKILQTILTRTLILLSKHTNTIDEKQSNQKHRSNKTKHMHKNIKRLNFCTHNNPMQSLAWRSIRMFEIFRSRTNEYEFKRNNNIIYWTGGGRIIHLKTEGWTHRKSLFNNKLNPSCKHPLLWPE